MPQPIVESPKGSRLRRLRSLAVRFGVFLLVVVAAIVAAAKIFPQSTQRTVANVLQAIFPRYLALRSGTGFFSSGSPSRTEVMVPMADGVRLSTYLYLPSGNGPFPTIVARTPYSKAEGEVIADFLGRYGYAVVVQDVRGRFGSEGDFYPMRAEAADGLALTQWVRQQPWCNGKIGGFGGSYLGFTQWAMAAGNPNVTSIAPMFTSSNFYYSVYNSGAFSKLTYLHWSLTSQGRYGNGSAAANIDRGYKHFPLISSDDVAFGDVPFYNDWVSHPAPDSYWRGLGVDHRISEVDAPAFLIAGWYDFVLEAELRDFGLAKSGARPRSREGTRIMIGPWTHNFFNPNQQRYGIKQRFLEPVPFEVVKELKDWYDYSLKAIDNGWQRRPAVRAWILGENRWRDTSDWPPPESSPQRYYLHSSGRANTADGDGRLSLHPPAAEAPDAFVFDPWNPAPTRGGAHGMPPDWGPNDQRDIEKRSDILVYSTPALDAPVVAMGTVQMELFATTSATDTDFTAKLVDVFPDGSALIVTEGIVRARYRNGVDKPELLKPGDVTRFPIRVGDTAVCFQKGHRIRLEVSSSNAPRYDPNPNTGTEIALESSPRRASQTIFHSQERPSALILPVVREEKARP